MDCDLRTDRGRCRKFDAGNKCTPSDKNWFDDELVTCEVDEVCRQSSIFGNRFYRLTEEDIMNLLTGKVLYSVGEYGTFIMFRSSKEDEIKQCMVCGKDIPGTQTICDDCAKKAADEVTKYRTEQLEMLENELSNLRNEIYLLDALGEPTKEVVLDRKRRN